MRRDDEKPPPAGAGAHEGASHEKELLLGSSDPRSAALGDPGTPGTHFMQEGDEAFVTATPWWEYWPRRWNVVAFALSADLVCYMDRANISVAMMPMAEKYGWSKGFQGARSGLGP